MSFIEACVKFLIDLQLIELTLTWRNARFN